MSRETVTTLTAAGADEDPSTIATADGSLPPWYANPKVTVLPLGDSITWGFDSSDLSGYRGPLFRLGLAAGKRINFVGQIIGGPATIDGVPFPGNNEGHVGWTIDTTPFPTNGLTPIVPPSTPQNGGTITLQDRATICLLMIGINDAINFPSGDATMVARLNVLLDKLVAWAPQMTIVLAQNTTYQGLGPQPLFDAYVNAIPGIVQARRDIGQRFRTCDMRVLTVADLTDQVHPNDQGYRKMADVWFAAIRDLL